MSERTEPLTTIGRQLTDCAMTPFVLLDFGYTLRKPVRCDWDKLHICNNTYKETKC